MSSDEELRHTVRSWYAGGLEHHAEELATEARLARLRAKRLTEEHRGESLRVFSEAMGRAEGELRKAAQQLRARGEEVRDGE